MASGWLLSEPGIKRKEVCHRLCVNDTRTPPCVLFTTLCAPWVCAFLGNILKIPCASVHGHLQPLSCLDALMKGDAVVLVVRASVDVFMRSLPINQL